MAQPRFTYPIEPMILGHMRANGLRSLAVQFRLKRSPPERRLQQPAVVDRESGDHESPAATITIAKHFPMTLIS